MITAVITALITALITAPVTVGLTLWWTGREATPTSLPLVTTSANAAPPPFSTALASPVSAPALERADLSWAPASTRVAATDLDGDGASEIVFAGPELSVFDAEGRAVARSPAKGGIDVLEAFGGAFYAGWGREKQVPAGDPPPRLSSVVRYTLGGGGLVTESIVSPESSRPQVVAVSPAGPDLLVAWFADKYSVSARRASRTGAGWTLTPVAEARTAPVWLSADLTGDGVLDVIYGRTYGDETGSPGDAWLVPGAPPGSSARATLHGAPILIPTTGGVRAGCVADTDGDGRPEVVLADGWDKDYGHKAQAQIRLVTWVNGAVQSTVLDRSPGDFDVSRVIAADLDGDRKDEILAVTNTRLRVVGLRMVGRQRRWVAWDTAPGLKDVAVAVDAQGVNIIVAGPRPESLRWPG